MCAAMLDCLLFEFWGYVTFKFAWNILILQFVCTWLSICVAAAWSLYWWLLV